MSLAIAALPEAGLCSVTITYAFAPICLTNMKKCQIMQCFAVPFKPPGPKMAKTVGYSNTTVPRVLALYLDALEGDRGIRQRKGRDRLQ